MTEQKKNIKQNNCSSPSVKNKKESSKNKTVTNKHRRRRSNSSKRDREQEVKRIKFLIAVISAIILIAGFFLIKTLLTPVNKGSLVGVNDDVLSYKEEVESACKKYGISQYSVLMLAIMQQESSGQGTDIFQCSESPFNTEYANSPGAIADPYYSILVGAETFQYCLKQAKCKSISNTDRVKLAIQEYNFGNHYAGWALENYGGYSPENAAEFSIMMQNELGWESYGDPEYVEHVLRYYSP